MKKARIIAIVTLIFTGLSGETFTGPRTMKFNYALFDGGIYRRPRNDHVCFTDSANLHS